jgi:hypothetical protein
MLNDQELGRMVDIHVQGLLLMGEKPLTEGKEYILSIEMPKALKEQGMEDAVVKGHLVWFRPSQTVPYVENGFEFTSISSESQKTLELLIDLFAMPSNSFNHGNN